MNNILCLIYLICIGVAFVSAQSIACQIIRGDGYPCQDYTVQTPDGYILTLQRVKLSNATKGVVLHQHGLTDNAVGACLNLPVEGYTYFLANAGYDVWLGNNRGNGISMGNIYNGPDTVAFWNFTYDQMAQYDFPTQINFVLAQTGARTLTYSGHSQGTTQAFAGLITNPALASKINLYIALAPVAYVHHTGSLLLRALANIGGADVLLILGDHEFFLPDAIHWLLPDICFLEPTLCDFSLELLFGPSTNLNESRISYYLNYEPNPTSVVDVIHWAQGVTAEVFQMYDYGYIGNLEHYGQLTPPQYPLQYFPSQLPLALFTGTQDYLADPTDVQTLIDQLPAPPVLVHNEPTYAHMDFIWAPSAQTLIYPDIVQLIAKYNPGYN